MHNHKRSTPDALLFNETSVPSDLFSGREQPTRSSAVAVDSGFSSLDGLALFNRSPSPLACVRPSILAELEPNKRFKADHTPISCPPTPRQNPAVPPGGVLASSATQHYPNTIKLLTRVFSTAKPTDLSLSQSWLTSHRTCVNASLSLMQAPGFMQPPSEQWACGREWVFMHRPVAGVLSHLATKPLDVHPDSEYSRAIQEIAHLLDLIRYSLSHDKAIPAMMDKIGYLGKGSLEEFGEAATNGTHWLRFTQALLTSALYGLMIHLDTAMENQSAAHVEAITSRAMQAFLRNTLNSLETTTGDQHGTLLSHYGVAENVSVEAHMVGVVSRTALAYLAKRLCKIPREVVAHSLRPALLQFCSSELSVGLVKGIHATIELFPGLFSGSFGQKLAEILTRLAEASSQSSERNCKAQITDPNVANENVVSMVQMILDIFRIFSAVGKIDCSSYVGQLCEAVAELTQRFPEGDGSVFDNTLAQFLHHYPEATVQFFFSLKGTNRSHVRTESWNGKQAVSNKSTLRNKSSEAKKLIERVLLKDCAYPIRAHMDRVVSDLRHGRSTSRTNFAAFLNFDQAEFSDVELHIKRGSEERVYRSHRVVLSAASPVFAALLTNGMQESGAASAVLEIPTEMPALGETLMFGSTATPFAAFEAVMQCIYSGSTPPHFPHDIILEVMAIADMLDLPHILGSCESTLESAIGADNVQMLLALAELRQVPGSECSPLYSACRTFVRSHGAQVDRRVFVTQITPLALAEQAGLSVQQFAEQLLCF